jgi:hypothetical protein
MVEFDESFGWRDEIKAEIITTFRENVSGRRYSKTDGHDGAEGHWLSALMGLPNDSDNRPDFKGFEMKKQTRGKTTFGDWSPTEALYKRNRAEFLGAFGTPNPEKGGRLSWSGEVFPKIGSINRYGQSMIVDESQSIVIFYSFSRDTRPDKLTTVPPKWQVEELVIAKWTSEKLRRNLESKFNTFGWFKLLADANGAYSTIQFGRVISWDEFIDLFSQGLVIIDCGMYEDNPRPYMQFRADSKIWDLFEEETIRVDKLP